MTQILKFPKDFLWGAATSAHQIEGNNTNSDWWAWEKSARRHDDLIRQGKNPKDFESGIACDSYNRFDEDFSLAQYLNHNATRLSIEWSRIEPEEGKFSEKELAHYEKVLQSAKFHHLTTFVTLHHFTSPAWFMKKGGFVKKANIQNFIRYAEITVKRLGEYADFWLTFNEPEVYVSQSYFYGVWPPQIQSLSALIRVTRNLISAHNLLAVRIKQLTQKPVSMAYKLIDLQPSGGLTRFIDKYIYERINRYFFSRTVAQSDFIGVNYYFHHHIEIFGQRKHSLSHHEVSDLGWGIHPEGLGRVLLSLKNIGKPIYITENGLADALDEKEKSSSRIIYIMYVRQSSRVRMCAAICTGPYWTILNGKKGLRRASD